MVSGTNATDVDRPMHLYEFSTSDLTDELAKRFSTGIVIMGKQTVPPAIDKETGVFKGGTAVFHREYWGNTLLLSSLMNAVAAHVERQCFEDVCGDDSEFFQDMPEDDGLEDDEEEDEDGEEEDWSA